MTSTLAAFGLRPVRSRAGVHGNALRRYRINPAGYATAIFSGDPVLLTAGYLNKVSVSTDYIIGVFMGCKYNDPTTKKPTWSEYYPANTSVGTDPDGIQAMVVADPDATFAIQADASVSVGDVGLNFDVTLGAGSTLTGRSGIGLKAGSRASTSQLLRVVDIYETPDNAFSDAYPIVEVEIVQHRTARLSAS